MRSLRSIVLIGGAGFIGSALARQLLANKGNEQLTILDTHDAEALPGSLAQISQDPRFCYQQGDLGDRNLVTRLLTDSKSTGVFNCADTKPPHPKADVGAEHFVATNIFGVTQLLAACRDLQVPLLQCSTDEVYKTTTSQDRLAEEAPLHPSTPYATSKACAELLCTSAFQTHGQDVLLTRGSMTFGPRQPKGQFLSRLIHQAVNNERLLLQGNGMKIRDWIHLDDHCAGLITTFQRGRAGEAYNLGGNCERTDLGIARHVLKVLGKPESLIMTDAPQAPLSSRRVLDCTKAVRYFSWYPKIDFKNHFAPIVRELAANLARSELTLQKSS